METKKIWSHLRDHHCSMAIKYCLSLRKGGGGVWGQGLSYVYESPHWGLSQNIWHAPFYGNWKVSIALRKGNRKKFNHCTIHNLFFFNFHKGAQPNFFSHLSLWQLKKIQSTQGVTGIGQDVATKKFQSPSYHHYFWDGNRIVFSHHKRRLSFFWKAFVESCWKVF